MAASGVVLASLLLAASTVGAQETAKNVTDKFPDAEEKETVTSTCSVCHTLARVAANRKDKAQWAQTIKSHEGRGLKLDREEAEVIVTYLAAYFGPMVNLNTATVAELRVLPHLDNKLAEAVAQYREKHGPFQKVEDVTRVEGFDSGILAQVRNRLSTGSDDGQEPKEKKQN